MRDQAAPAKIRTLALDSLGVFDVPLLLTGDLLLPLVHDNADEKARLGQRQRVNVLELAEVQLRPSLLISSGLLACAGCRCDGGHLDG